MFKRWNYDGLEGVAPPSASGDACVVGAAGMNSTGGGLGEI